MLKIEQIWFLWIISTFIYCFGAEQAEVEQFVEHSPRQYSFYKNPDPERCGATVNFDIQRYDNITQGLECLRKGYRNVYWERGNVLNEYDQTRSAELEAYAKNKIEFWNLKDGSKETIYYAPGKITDAYLLAKYLVDKSYIDFLASFYNACTSNKSVKLEDSMRLEMQPNPFLLGKLLGYADSDNELFLAFLSPAFDSDELFKKIHTEGNNKVPFGWATERKEAVKKAMRDNEEFQKNMLKSKFDTQLWVYSHRDWLRLPKNYIKPISAGLGNPLQASELLMPLVTKRITEEGQQKKQPEKAASESMYEKSKRFLQLLFARFYRS